MNENLHEQREETREGKGASDGGASQQPTSFRFPRGTEGLADVLVCT
jgi:hypothetical protein